MTRNWVARDRQRELLQMGERTRVLGAARSTDTKGNQRGFGACWANDEFRSVNAQVEMLLRRASAQAGRAATPARPSPNRERLTCAFCTSEEENPKKYAARS